MGNRFRNYLILRKIHKYFLNFMYAITSAIKLQNIITPKSKFLRMIYFFCLKENLIFYISFDNVKFYINSSDSLQFNLTNSETDFSNMCCKRCAPCPPAIALFWYVNVPISLSLFLFYIFVFVFSFHCD